LDPIDRKEPSDQRDNGNIREMAPRVTGPPPSQPLVAVGEPPATSYDHNSEETDTGPP
jgi:hypothetical protein